MEEQVRVGLQRDFPELRADFWLFDRTRQLTLDYHGGDFHQVGPDPAGDETLAWIARFEAATATPAHVLQGV